MDTLAEAYLLNTNEAGLDAAKKGFRFESFDLLKIPSADEFAGKGYNGVIHVYSSDRLSGHWTEVGEKATVEPALRAFFKAILTLR